MATALSSTLVARNFYQHMILLDSQVHFYMLIILGIGLRIEFLYLIVIDIGSLFAYP